MNGLLLGSYVINLKLIWSHNVKNNFFGTAQRKSNLKEKVPMPMVAKISRAKIRI